MTHNAPVGLRAGLLSAALLTSALAAQAQALPAPEALMAEDSTALIAESATAVEAGPASAEGTGEAASAPQAADEAASAPPAAGDTAAPPATEDAASAASAAASGAESGAGETKVPAAAGQAGQAAQAAEAPASAPAPGPRVRNKLDPWENWNRKVFSFNEKLDENVLRPVATAYSQLVPSPARQAVDNFFGNFSDAWSAVNLFLQGRFKTGAQQTMRVAVNSVLGIAGLIDIATPAGLDKTTEDLGRTLGYWGVKTGPYIVWPILGPSSLRDSVTLPVNFYYSPAYLFDDGEYKVAITALQLVNTRASLLKVTDMLDGIALDKYTFVRDAYLQRRNIKAHSSSDDEEDDYEVITPDEKPATP